MKSLKKLVYHVNPETDRAMLCGSPAFLKDVAALLDQHGLKESPRMGEFGDYVIERAFVEKSKAVESKKTELNSSVFCH